MENKRRRGSKRCASLPSGGLSGEMSRVAVGEQGGGAKFWCGKVRVSILCMAGKQSKRQIENSF